MNCIYRLVMLWHGDILDLSSCIDLHNLGLRRACGIALQFFTPFRFRGLRGLVACLKRSYPFRGTKASHGCPRSPGQLPNLLRRPVSVEGLGQGSFRV